MELLEAHAPLGMLQNRNGNTGRVYESDLLGAQTPWLKIHDPLCCKKTFPDFFDKLQALHTASHA